VVNQPRTSPFYESSALGAEGEMMVGRVIGRTPARSSDRLTINGRRRDPDFATQGPEGSIAQGNVVFEVKNKAQLSTSGNRSDVAQIRDFAALAAQTNGDVIL
jgi:hypothetical protein